MSLETVVNVLVLVALAVLGILHKMASETRREILDTLKDLAAKVGLQNGRVGRLEEWKTEHSKWKEEALEHVVRRVDRLENTEREDLRRNNDDTDVRKRRR
jgi:hypothetical protein